MFPLTTGVTVRIPTGIVFIPVGPVDIPRYSTSTFNTIGGYWNVCKPVPIPVISL